MAGGTYDLQNFDQVQLKMAWSNIILKSSYIRHTTS